MVAPGAPAVPWQKSGSLLRHPCARTPPAEGQGPQHPVKSGGGCWGPTNITLLKTEYKVRLRSWKMAQKSQKEKIIFLQFLGTWNVFTVEISGAPRRGPMTFRSNLVDQ
eukprot:6727072-Pyramimonas_sp.AAC.1